ncbi:MAG TPA: PHP domain-containing protein [Candidatus Omnitrophota bacterium]|nr:PHP domain-containing protein [Candidatus Omnitrophota bacterium]HQL40703.1 PHP domain-containing protein [Candidatus Omnitrophota bacterium]
MRVKADFHIHSTVSPCASLEMSPQNIVAAALKKGMSLIALTDHNCTRNCPAFFSLCQRSNLFCLGGAEVTTREECHVLCLFQDLETIQEFGSYVEAHLPDVRNQPEIFGDQVYVNEEEEVLGFVEKYLGNATTISFYDLCASVRKRNGLIIPAHVDRMVFGLVSQLGFIPAEPIVDALEVYHAQCSAVDLGQHPYALVSSSDAHLPKDIGCVYNEIEMPTLSLAHLKQALNQKKVVIRLT